MTEVRRQVVPHFIFVVSQLMTCAQLDSFWLARVQLQPMQTTSTLNIAAIWLNTAPAVRSTHGYLFACLQLVIIDNSVMSLTLVSTVTWGYIFIRAQTACSYVTSGSPDHARPRRVMFKDPTLSTPPNPI